MHCVVQTPDFDSSVKQLGLTETELHRIVNALSADPHIGEAIQGTGGARKWRVPGKGKGKSGGYRVVSFYAGDDVPVFLLGIFSKGERINLSKAERNELKAILGGIAADYRQQQIDKVAVLTEHG